MTAYESSYERFWSMVDRSRPGCWLWTGAKISTGYGNFVPDGRGSHVLAHRWAYESAFGRIPTGFDIDHLCRNPSCVRPSHLEAVSHRENVLRGVGITAQYAKRDHCKHGHPLTEDNIYRPPSHPNARLCRECRRIMARKVNERRRRARAGA